MSDHDEGLGDGLHGVPMALHQLPVFRAPSSFRLPVDPDASTEGVIVAAVGEGSIEWWVDQAAGVAIEVRTGVYAQPDEDRG